MFNFLDLPEDILLEICTYIGPQGLLALKQTCRVLHALGCTHHVWNQMMIDFPLDLPLRANKQALPALQIQCAVIKALRLDYNWRTHSARIRQFKGAMCDNAVDQMQPLGSQWLITLSRSPSSTQISVWDVGGSRCSRIASVETSTALRFSADLYTQSKMVIAVIEHNDPRNEHLNVYSLCLTEGENERGPSTGNLELCHSIFKPLSRGTFFDVHAYGCIVAAAVARFSGPTSPPAYEVVIVDTSTHRQWVFDPGFSLGVERVRLKLSLNRIVLVGVEASKTLLIREFGLSSFFLLKKTYKLDNGTAVNSYIDRLPDGVDNTNLILLNYDAIQFPTEFDVHLSLESANGTSGFIPIVVFPSLVVPTGGLAYMIKFPLSPTTHNMEGMEELQGTIQIPMQQFSTSAKTSADILCVGRTGYRAVWIQRRWDNDEFEFMKTTFSSSDELVDVIPLLPKHTPLPFKSHACQSLAFDEASGRLYISVHTGELFILDL
ncbi:hypothetical protein BDZ94DRAFT_1247185 [Collybia nuda]|uniref:F-box domain-containing protein n=1 Tax=Collybia nuda TaxID=64659 RepID=A0A9P5YGE8_9AGAR|nr:hypothetical protein BDZ94DRAFT_1247185 [Collybia nuda]